MIYSIFFHFFFLILNLLDVFWNFELFCSFFRNLELFKTIFLNFKLFLIFLLLLFYFHNIKTFRLISFNFLSIFFCQVILNTYIGRVLESIYVTVPNCGLHQEFSWCRRIPGTCFSDSWRPIRCSQGCQSEF